MNSTVTDASPELLRAVVDSSLTSIYAARAVRDTATGELIDFQIYFGNPAFCQRVRLSEADIQAQTLRTLFPVLVETGFFDHYRQVVETGEAFEGEQEYPGPNGHFWYQTTVKKLDDGVVVNFIDITPYRQARQQAQQAVEMVQTLVDNLPLAITLLRPQRENGPDSLVTDLIFERVNQTAARLRGLPVEQMVGQPYSRLFPGASAEGGVAYLSNVLASGQSQQYDLEYRVDGLNGWFEQRNVPVGDQLILITQDITARKQTELQLLQSTQLVDDIVQVMPNGMVIAEAMRDPDGTITDFRVTLNNPAARQLAGVSADDVGRTILTIDPPLRETGLFDRYVALTQTGEPFSLEYSFRGRELALSVSKLNDGFITMFTDVTGRKQAELKLQETNRQLQSTLDASISSILALTAIRNEANQIVDFRMEKANRSVERSLGKTPAELEGRTLLSVYPGNVESGFFALYAKAADTGEAQQATFHYTDRNGYEGWFEASAVQQEKDKIVLTFMNVSEHKQALEQLAQLNAQLHRSNESLDQFAAVASHDLQEPLRKIKSFGDLLITQYSSRLGDGVDLLQRMQSAADRMQNLIRDLLTYSRLAKSGGIEQQSVNMRKVVDDVLIDLEVVVAEKRAVVEVGNLPTLPGDAVQLRQLFQNLLSNALKFTKAGRTPCVTVSARPVAPDEKFVEMGLPRGQYWQIVVADNGIGFSEKYRERIFGAFERLHSKNSVYAGTGIGLAIVRRVMDNHAGIVTAHATEGEGATFTLYFPAHY